MTEGRWLVRLLFPGTPGLEHRIGGIEKQHITGNVNYDPENHHLMVKLRQEKIDRAVMTTFPWSK